ncbi:hypothetical protein EU527_16490 [Candidatus Thorarchaeota archaeon]|nr:MAG: hypothetical protein EU527_16490 [Candidatus Thorarchaeota archaeon]
MEIDSGPGPYDSGPSKYSKELTVTGLVSETVRLWTRKLPQYVVIVGITGLLFSILQIAILLSLYGVGGLYLIDYIGTTPIDTIFNFLLLPFTNEILMTFLVLSILSLIIYSIIGGAAIDYAFDDYENPGSANIGDSFSYALGRAVHLIGVQFIQSIIIIPLGLVALLLLFANPFISIALIFLLLYVAVRLGVAVAIVITEEKSAIPALNRSWQITGGLFVHVFAGQLLMGIIAIIINLILAVIIGMVVVVIVFDLDIAVAIGTIIASIFVGSLSYIFQAVLYKDLESRGISHDVDMWQ